MVGFGSVCGGSRKGQSGVIVRTRGLAPLGGSEPLREVHDASGAFEQKNVALRMENCTAFIRACRKLGVLEKDLFSTVDLYAAGLLRTVPQSLQGSL